MPLSERTPHKTDDPLIRADDISVHRHGKAVLDRVSLSVAPGDFIAIVGPNGAGKTTLLKCLLGLVPADQGTIYRKPGLKISYLSQEPAVDRNIPITVRRFLSLRRLCSPHDIEQAAAETGVSEVLEQQFHVLSSGLRQRVLLARALLRQPQLLILDEPAANLDISGQLELYKLLETLYHKRDLAVLMISHDLHLVMATTTTVICLFHHICCQGEPRSVANDPEFVALFGDNMARLMAVYRHAHDHDHDHALVPTAAAPSAGDSRPV